MAVQDRHGPQHPPLEPDSQPGSTSTLSNQRLASMPRSAGSGSSTTISWP